MNRDFLQDYERKEFEQIRVFEKKIMEGGFGQDEIYPPKQRFVKLQEPLARCTGVFGEIWPLIPLYGSLVIGIVPRPVQRFAEAHGFEVRDLERLIDFCKDTGKVQFVLQTRPTDYEGLDYLEPLFSEIRPPMPQYMPFELLMEQTTLKRYWIEFMTLAEIAFARLVRTMTEVTYPGAPHAYVSKRMSDYFSDYAAFRALGYDELAERVLDLMVTSPLEAFDWFNIFGSLLGAPVLDALRAIPVHPIEVLREASALSKQNAVKVSLQLPFEIGKVLMRKLTLMPESFEAAKELVAHYKHEDLYSVMKSLEQGVKFRKIDVINAKSDELSAVLDNIWADAGKVTKRISEIRFGISVIPAIVGPIIAGPIGAIGGLLGSLGYNVAERALSQRTQSVSERLAKMTVPNYLASICDFKKKYKIEG